MKLLIFIISVLMCINVKAQTPESTIKGFLNDLKKGSRSFNDIIKDYVAKISTQDTIDKNSKDYKDAQMVYLESLKELGTRLQSVDISSIQIVKYNDAPDSLKIMALNDVAEKTTYIARNNSGFIHYFHLTGIKIDSWIRFKGGKAFLGYGL